MTYGNSSRITLSMQRLLDAAYEDGFKAGKALGVIAGLETAVTDIQKRIEKESVRAGAFSASGLSSLGVAYGETVRDANPDSKFLNDLVADAGLSMRPNRILRDHGIGCLGDIPCVIDLLAMWHFGEGSLEEVRNMLGEKGLALPFQPEPLIPE